MEQQKIAVITGASRGLGLVLVRAFAESGWRAIGTGRSAQPDNFPAGAVYRQFDAGDVEACEAFWQELRSEYPDAQVCLVNNAGGYVSGSLVETKPADYAQQMQSSYFTAVYMTRGLALAVPAARIINIVSSSALVAHQNNSAYGAAKAAQMHFFQSLQEEFTPEQYQITNLYPSDIATHGDNPDAIDPADLAQFVCEQAGNRASYYLRDVTVYPLAKK